MVEIMTETRDNECQRLQLRQIFTHLTRLWNRQTDGQTDNSLQQTHSHNTPNRESDNEVCESRSWLRQLTIDGCIRASPHCYCTLSVENHPTAITDLNPLCLTEQLTQRSSGRRRVDWRSITQVTVRKRVATHYQPIRWVSISHSTQTQSFRRASSQPISCVISSDWLGSSSPKWLSLCRVGDENSTNRLIVRRYSLEVAPATRRTLIDRRWTHVASCGRRLHGSSYVQSTTNEPASASTTQDNRTYHTPPHACTHYT